MAKEKDTKKKKKRDMFEEESQDTRKDKSLIAEVRGTTQYTKFARVVEIVQRKLDLAKDQQEAYAMHAGRKSRTLAGSKQYSPKALLDVSMQDSAYRSRMVEMRVTISVMLSSIEEAVGDMRRYIGTQYSEELSVYGTVENRRAMIDRILKRGVAIINDGIVVQKMLDDFIKDIDQNGYTIKNCVEVLKLLDGSKGKVL